MLLLLLNSEQEAQHHCGMREAMVLGSGGRLVSQNGMRAVVLSSGKTK